MIMICDIKIDVNFFQTFYTADSPDQYPQDATLFALLSDKSAELFGSENLKWMILIL